MQGSKQPKLTLILSTILGVVLFGIAGFFIYKTVDLTKTLEIRTTEKQTVTAEKSVVSNTLREAELTIEALTSKLSLTEEELEELENDYRREKNKNDDFEEQIDVILGTVGDLDKLAKIDEELLQKYSKVSFLNEHYAPEKLREIDDAWKYSEDKSNSLHSKTMAFFENMLEGAKEDEVDLWVVSAYRSFSTQEQLKGAYTVTYGSGANAFSADQGFSEHQLGTTVDFTTNNLGGGLSGFGNTEAYAWLKKNAYKYGFILSYPEKNGYYVFEPWHWRFVGKNLADYLHDKNLDFYDMEQREIDQYLIKTFD